MFRIIGNPEIRNVEWSTDDGRTSEGNRGIFPICTRDGNNRLTLIGTAFFICTNGVFVTAKHVLMDRLGAKPIEPLIAIQFVENNQYFVRPVLNVSINNTDVAIGSLAPMKHNVTGEQLLNPVMTLTTSIPIQPSVITTFAYPKSWVKDNDRIREMHFETSWHSGYVIEYLPDGRDNVMLPGPCYRTTMEILHGASGGPVMNTGARVFGINSTGYEGVTESYVSAIHGMRGLELPNVMLLGETLPRAVTINELIDRGLIVVE